MAIYKTVTLHVSTNTYNVQYKVVYCNTVEIVLTENPDVKFKILILVIANKHNITAFMLYRVLTLFLRAQKTQSKLFQLSNGQWSLDYVNILYNTPISSRLVENNIHQLRSLVSDNTMEIEQSKKTNANRRYTRSKQKRIRGHFSHRSASEQNTNPIGYTLRPQAQLEKNV